MMVPSASNRDQAAAAGSGKADSQKADAGSETACSRAVAAGSEKADSQKVDAGLEMACSRAAGSEMADSLMAAAGAEMKDNQVAAADSEVAGTGFREGTCDHSEIERTGDLVGALVPANRCQESCQMRPSRAATLSAG